MKLKDHNIALYSILSSALRLLSGPLAIFLIINKLTVIEQSLYYTFISITAIQWVFELGVSTCLIQYISSEKLDEKVRAYIRFGFLFFLCSSTILFFSMLFYASWVFNDISIKDWIYPWLLYSFFVSSNIFLNFIYVINEGKLKIKKVYKIKFYSGIAYSIFLLFSLYLGFGLYSLAISQIALLLVTILGFRKSILDEINNIYFTNKEEVKNVFYEIIPFQSKLSLVWISGYLYWNFYTIYIFKYTTIQLSSQFGATNAILSALSTAMLSLIITKRANLGRLYSDNGKNKFYNLVASSFFISIIGFIFGSIVIIIAINSDLGELSKRLLSGLILYQIIVLRFLMFVYEYALVILRSFKKEPLFKITIFNYILTPLLLICSSLLFGVNNMFIIPIIVQLLFVFYVIPFTIKYMKNNFISETKVSKVLI